MILIRLRGGLGNQLFQYAAGRSLADRLRIRLALDLRHFSDKTKHTGYALDAFNIRAELASPSELVGWPNLATELGLRIPPLRPLLRRWYFEKRFSFDPDLAKVKGPVCLIGYWQSERYFSEIASDIRADLTLRNGVNRLDREFISLAEAGDSVAIHVRRGDYASDPSAQSVHGTCSVAYYQDAVAVMRRLRPGCHFLVFSDDPNWARLNLPLGNDAVFVAGNSDRPELDLALMRACSHHIIANSTFSWWGAWLAKKPGQVVVAPVPWFESKHHDSRDLQVLGWNYLRRT